MLLAILLLAVEYGERVYHRCVRVTLLVVIMWKVISHFRLRCVILAFIFVLCFPCYSFAASSITPNYDVPEQLLKIIHPTQTLVLKCTIDDSEASKFTFKWRKDGKEIDMSVSGVDMHSEQHSTELTIGKAKDANAGVYECVANHNTTSAELSATIYVVSKPIVSMESDHIVVEGEKLTLDCRTSGVPAPTVVWMFENTTFTNNTDRVKFVPKDDIPDVPNAVLQIDDAKLSDRGEYKCLVSNNATRGSTITASTRVRVKDKLAALWPFLGICAEVFVLCAIIFIYEKKRNKAELDESDTDNSPEQKNTPDHGKDSVRQRK